VRNWMGVAERQEMAENEELDLLGSVKGGMEEGEVGARKPGERVWVLMAACLCALGVSVALGLFDHFTILVPDNGKVEESCFWIAGLGGLIVALLAIWLTAGVGALRRGWTVFLLGVVGILATFLLCSRVTEIGEGLVEFPAGKTRTVTAMMPIGRAYHTHGKGAAAHIQTMGPWSDMDVTEGDYEFMKTHRMPGDAGKDPDEISSRGYFCARVTLEVAGENVRVMHAGAEKLPMGTVVVCGGRVQTGQ